MNGILTILIMRFLETDFPAILFVERYIDRWRMERNTGILDNYADQVRGFLSSIFYLADLYNDSEDREDYELDEELLKSEIKNEISLHGIDKLSTSHLDVYKFDVQCRAGSIEHNEIVCAVSALFLGEITPNIRGVTFSVGSGATFRIIFDGIIEADKSGFVNFVKEILLSQITQYCINVECIQVDFPADLQKYHLGYWVYLRKEIGREDFQF